MEQYITLFPVASTIFVLTLITTIMAFTNETLYGKLMLHPYSVSKGRYLYTVITSGLIHKDWMHLAFNMITFYSFAFRLEGIIGHWQFAVLYILSLILSDIPSIVKHKNDFWYHSLGASGAISAVLFSFILFEPMSKLYIMPIPFAINSIIFGVLYLVYCTYASKHSQDAINHDAHLFGALSGLGITIILVPSVVPYFFNQISAAIR